MDAVKYYHKRVAYNGILLALPWYSGNLSIMIQSLRTSLPDVKQVWLAGDSTGSGQIVPLYIWYNPITSVKRERGTNIWWMNQRAGWLASRTYLQRGCLEKKSILQILLWKGPWMERRNWSAIWDSKEPASASYTVYTKGCKRCLCEEWRWQGFGCNGSMLALVASWAASLLRRLWFWFFFNILLEGYEWTL